LTARVSARFGVLVIAIAIVLVPAIARARQHVEHCDATRLSIKHSWLGVAPPSKASLTPQQIVVIPTISELPEPRQVTSRDVAAPELALHPVLDLSPDPLRGPPSAFLL
jgi:hypothetical protein